MDLSVVRGVDKNPFLGSLPDITRVAVDRLMYLGAVDSSMNYCPRLRPRAIVHRTVHGTSDSSFDYSTNRHEISVYYPRVKSRISLSGVPEFTFRNITTQIDQGHRYTSIY